MGTLVQWAFAPTWLTIEQARKLSGYDLETLKVLVDAGTLDTREDGGEILIEKAALREYQEAWLDMRAVQLSQEDA